MNEFKAGDEIAIVKITPTCQSNLKVGDKAIIDFLFFSTYERAYTSASMLCDKNIGSCFHNLENIKLVKSASKPVTVIYDGNIYEIGKYYLFSMNSLDWIYAKLTNINAGYDKVFCTPQEDWLYIKEVPASENMGTITPAPAELIEGRAYTFNYEGQNTDGIYDAQSERFYYTKGRHLLVSSCTNIRLMTVENK
jgi:hypothetical protein